MGQYPKTGYGVTWTKDDKRPQKTEKGGGKRKRKRERKTDKEKER